MKKVLSIVAASAMLAIVACGPSAEEKAKLEERAKFIQDSISASISESMQNTEATPDSTAPAATTETAAPAESHEGHGH